MGVVKEDNNPYAMKSSSPELRVNDASNRFPPRALLGSLLVMLPWPLVGIAACLGLSLFEKSSEAIFMFGSVTMLFLLPLAFVVSSEWVFGALIGIVWLLVLFLPLGLGKKSLHPRFRVGLVLVYQSLFSAIQAGFGFLVILGKQC
jgi:hypothetical protein